MQDRMIGAVRVTRIEEMMGPGFPADQFFPEFDAATFKAHEHWLAPRYFDPASGKLISSIHSWLVRTGRHTILIDTCNGNHKPRPGMPRFDMLDTPYLDRLKAAGVAPEQVDFVMCTHLHVDHVGWNTRLEDGRWVPTFPNAKYVMSAADHAHWSAAVTAADTPQYERNVYNDSVLPVVEKGAAVMVGAGHQCGDHVTVRASPGHTPGHIHIDLRSDGRRAVFSGDALHNPVQVPLWRWNSRFCLDPDQARRTRHDLLADCAETGALLMPAHFGPPHAARIRARGDAFELDWDSTGA
ncbi:MAG: MBL fold metallo-hydrolase [Rhodospirillales bacterium]|nr:MAG: MBL fold metallo-hydrolase [Rhodospirillales bacterium]